MNCKPLLVSCLLLVNTAWAEINCYEQREQTAEEKELGVLIFPMGWIPNYQMLDCENIEKSKQQAKKEFGWCGKEFELIEILSGARCADVTKKEEYCTRVQVKINFKGFGCKN